MYKDRLRRGEEIPQDSNESAAIEILRANSLRIRGDVPNDPRVQSAVENRQFMPLHEGYCAYYNSFSETGAPIAGGLHGYGPYVEAVVFTKVGVTDPYNEQCIRKRPYDDYNFYGMAYETCSELSDSENEHNSESEELENSEFESDEVKEVHSIPARIAPEKPCQATRKYRLADSGFRIVGDSSPGIASGMILLARPPAVRERVPARPQTKLSGCRRTR